MASVGVVSKKRSPKKKIKEKEVDEENVGKKTK
jgi:hypothetical protein